ncbi:MAG: helicase [Myxococcales bacterium]
MIVLHAAPVGDVLLWWGERSAAVGARWAEGEPHPSCVPISEPLGDWASGAQGRDVVGWLPCAAIPLPSTPLLGEVGGAVRTAPVRIAGLVLDPAAERELLTRDRTVSAGPPVVLAGPEVGVWAGAARLASSLVARQRMLPSLRREPWRAVWEPVPTAADAEVIAALAAALPAGGRCIPPHPSARDAVMAVVGRHVDALAREERPRVAPGGSTHARWAMALRGPADPAALADVPERELVALEAALRDWRAPLDLGEAAPWRLALRLEEPSREQGWTLRPLLCPTDDPSLLVGVDAPFSAATDSAVLRALARPGADLRAFALVALSRAAAAAPVLAAAFRASPPRPVALDAADAFTFLTETALLLEAAGFVVLLPSWFTGAGRRLTVRAQAEAPTMKASAGLHMGAVVHVNWQLALGDEVLTPGELEELAALKAPLVRLRGQWTVVDPDRVRQVVERWGRGETTVRELARAAIGATPVAGLPVSGVDATGALGELLDRLLGRSPVPELPPPTGFHGALRPYQSRGLAWLAYLTDLGLGACLADDMGLGKTVQTLALVLRSHLADPRPVLLVCPTSLLANWQREAARFAPSLPVRVYHGAGRALPQGGLALTSYGLLLRDVETLRRVEWAGLVLDEAQNVKNAATRQARAARALRASWRVALTGTPVENHAGDLWSLLDLLNPGLLGSAASFQRTFFDPIQGGDKEAAARLRRLTAPFVLRRLKTDPGVAPDLPRRLVTTVACTLTREQATLYEAVLSEARAALAEAEGMKRKGVVLSTITRLKQVCNHPAQLLRDGSAAAGRSGKLERATEILAEVVDSGGAALVFTQYAEMGRLLGRHLREALGLEAPFLHGGLPRDQRDAMVERFQAGGPPVLILSLKAGGTGLNLTRANHVLHYDRWWNPAVEGQASDRAWRIGQRRQVLVHTLVCAGTFEERIDALLARKRRVATQLVGAGEAWLTELGDDELQELLALRKESDG